MKIRKAKMKDSKEIGEIYFEASIDESRLQFPKKNKLEVIREINRRKKDRIKEFKEEIYSERSYWVVAEINDEVVGFANADINKNKEGRFTMLYVKRKFREKGIGKKLTKERLNWLKKMKARSIEAGPYVKNKSSISNLKKFGFKPVSIKMQKRLK